MKSARFSKVYRSNSSKLHQKIGNVLKESASFKNFKIYQEYPSNKVNTIKGKANLHYDWVILDLKVIIEGHGKQHYTSDCSFGEKDPLKAIENFQSMKERDAFKKEIAIEAGFSYVEIPYSDEKRITERYLLNKINLCFNTNPLYKEVEPTIINNDYKNKQKELRREHNKRQYRLSKERKKKENL